MTDETLIEMLRALGARREAELVPEPDSARLKAAVAAKIGVVEAAPAVPDEGALIAWVHDQLARLIDTARDGYRSVANEVYVRAKRETRFRTFPDKALFLAIARGVYHVHEELARSAPAAPTVVNQADVETIITLAGVRKHLDTSRAQFDRLAVLRGKDQSSWEVYVLYHFAGRTHAELDDWYPKVAGQDVFVKLAVAKRAVVGTAG